MVTIPELNKAEHYIDMVITGRLTSVILISEGGLGKSYLAVKKVKQLVPDRYQYFSGHITSLSLYKLLYRNNESIIILDDVEELLSDSTAIGILKSALWDVDGKRTVTYATTSDKADDVPDHFEFKGGIIILCNEIPREKNPAVKALASRTVLYRIRLTYEQKRQIMNMIIDDCQDFTKEDRTILKKELLKQTSICTDNFNLRTLQKLIAFYKYNKEVFSSNKELFISLFSDIIETDDLKSIVWELIQSKLEVKKQVEQFTKMSGHSRATFFRIKKDLVIEQSIKVSKKNNETMRQRDILSYKNPENSVGEICNDQNKN
jgi:hypothetical protein